MRSSLIGRGDGAAMPEQCSLAAAQREGRDAAIAWRTAEREACASSTFEKDEKERDRDERASQ